MGQAHATWGYALTRQLTPLASNRSGPRDQDTRTKTLTSVLPPVRARRYRQPWRQPRRRPTPSPSPPTESYSLP
jgi:hypothetical protein